MLLIWNPTQNKSNVTVHSIGWILEQERAGDYCNFFPLKFCRKSNVTNAGKLIYVSLSTDAGDDDDDDDDDSNYEHIMMMW